MTNKIIVAGIIAVLFIGLIYLGLEVKNLRAEVVRVSDPVSYSPQAANTQTASSKAVQQPNASAQNNWQYVPVARWDPYNEMMQMHRRMNQLLNQASQGDMFDMTIPANNMYQLNTDIRDSKDKYTITMDIPGMEKSDINVEVKGKTLLVSGNRTKNTEEKNANYYRQERSFGSFSQAFPLPDDANASGISVNYTKGVLSIDIPKLAKADKKKEETTKIKVN